MVSDRTLQRVFGMGRRAVALWGTPIRAFAVLITCLGLAGLTGAYVNTVRNTIEIRHGQDFGVFYESARARPAVDPRTQGGAAQDTGALPSPNLNPPHFIYLLRPFTWVDLPQAFLAWLATSILALLLSVVVIVRTAELRWRATAALSVGLYVAAPTVATLLTGQVGLVLLLPFTIAWARARQHRYVSAGVWIGVCASVKPFFLLFVPYLAVRRQMGAAVGSLVPVVGLFGIGIAYYGVDAYQMWIDDLVSVSWAEHYLNASVLGFVERTLSTSAWQQVPIVHAPKMVAPLWITICAGVSVATLWRVRSISSVDAQFLLITSAALLLSPLGWTYYLWFLAPPVVVVVSEFAAVGRREILLGLGLAGFLAPPLLPRVALEWSYGLGTATFGSIYFWSLAALWVVAMRALRIGDGHIWVHLLLVARRPVGCRDAGA